MSEAKQFAQGGNGALPSAESADDIFVAEDLSILPVPVPEWGRTVHLRVLSAEEGIAVGKQLKPLQGGDNETEAAFIILRATLVTADGKRRLIESDEQLARLRARNHLVISRLHMAALKLQRWMPDQEPAKNVSSEAVPAASPTVSQPS